MNSTRLLYADTELAVVLKYSGDICETSESAGEISSVSSKSISSDNKTDITASPYLPDIMHPEIESYLGISVPFCECVHRLDRPVSGICILALNRKSASALSAQFANHDSTDKIYLAVTESRESVQNADFRADRLQAYASLQTCTPFQLKNGSDSAETKLSCYMIFDPKAKKARIVAETGRKAKKAELLYRIIGIGDRYTFVKVRLLTGRTHQIRCQLAVNGMPVKGDVKYGARRSDPLGGIRLHAYQLSFTHPVTKKRCCFTANPPVTDPLWQACLDAFAQLPEV